MTAHEARRSTAEESALIGVETMQILEGQLPERVYGLVAEWGVRHRALLRENWRRAIAREPLLSISLLSPFDGVFEPLRDPARFREVFVDDGGTVAWPNGVDLAPEILYSKVSGHPLAQR